MECANRECFCSGEVAIDRAGGTYCSERCVREESGGGSADACGCGHAGCAPLDRNVLLHSGTVPGSAR